MHPQKAHLANTLLVAAWVLGYPNHRVEQFAGGKVDLLVLAALPARRLAT